MIYFLSLGAAFGGQERAIQEYARETDKDLCGIQQFFLKKVDGLRPQANFTVSNNPVYELLQQLIKRRLMFKKRDTTVVLVGNRAAYLWPIFFFWAKTYLYLHTEANINGGAKGIVQRVLLRVSIFATTKTYSVGTTIPKIYFKNSKKIVLVIPDFATVLPAMREATFQQKGYSFLYCGELSEKKGCNLLINCFLRLPTHYRLTLIGRKTDSFDFKGCEFAENIEVKPFTNCEKTLDENFSSSDIYISLSQSETFGLSVLNALQFEIPVICTNITGHRNCLGEDYPYFVNSEDNSFKIATGIIDIIAQMEKQNFLTRLPAIKHHRIEYLQDRQFSKVFLNQIKMRN